MLDHCVVAAEGTCGIRIVITPAGLRPLVAAFWRPIGVDKALIATGGATNARTLAANDVASPPQDFKNSSMDSISSDIKCDCAYSRFFSRRSAICGRLQCIF